ncbi:MAG: hypothetical protein MSC30_07550 [Gaiellaceae bacterium MAG52_C11]|nr:hypothetical protein [Candidatus Gaiellasilicea maunaloa]
MRSSHVRDRTQASPNPRRTGDPHALGRIVVDYGDREETVTGGQAYYVEPGHLISFEEDSEAVEFTPTHELERTLEVVRANVARAKPDGD